MKLFTDFKIRRIVALVAFSLETLLLLLFFFFGVRDGNAFTLFAADSEIVATGTKIIHILVLLVTAVNIILSIRGLALEIYKKRSLGNEISCAVLNLMLMIVAAANKIYNLVFPILVFIYCKTVIIYGVSFIIIRRIYINALYLLSIT